jgi:tetratricopeptide (TPR) repeat protein
MRSAEGAVKILYNYYEQVTFLSRIMKKKYLLPAIAIIVVIGIFIVLRHSKTAGLNIKPEVLNVGNAQVSIAWMSKDPYKGRVFYKPAGSNSLPQSALETLSSSNHHEVKITGLNASTRYVYWVGNSKTHYQFQTQPTFNTPFSFLMVWGNVSKRLMSLMMSEAPEFIVSLSDTDKEGADWFQDARAYVPIYDLIGIDSIFLRSISTQQPEDAFGPWNLDWGGLRMVFFREISGLADKFDTPSVHTFGIITSSEAAKAFKNEKGLNTDNIIQTSLHSIITMHNKQNPARPVAFVGIVGRNSETVEVDGVCYFGIPVTFKDAGAIRIDIDSETASAFFLDEKKEVSLKKPPLKQKRTCEECRRLADKGSYEESVQAYKEFIEANYGHSQIDDAYFAIAQIYDEKLFVFKEALDWYRRLIQDYPDGTLTPLAQQRISYLSLYSDYDFKPLERFERIRKVEFARKQDSIEERDKLLNEIKSLINEYSDSKLAPFMQYWLANQYRHKNDVSRAVDAYLGLRQIYPLSIEAQEVSMEIAETYYEAGRYPEAIEAYKRALSELPALQDTIKAQIRRSIRNIRRAKITFVCWVIWAFISILGVITKAFRIDRIKIISSLIASIVLGVLLFFGAWLIYEQFSSL